VLITSLPVEVRADVRSPAATEPPSVHVMNVRTLLIPLLCLGAVVFACGPRSRSEASLVAVSLTTKSPVPVPAHLEKDQPVRQQKPARKRESSVTKITPTFAVQVDKQAIRFTLDVTNVGRKNVELTFPDGQTHDFAVLDSAGREVYRWGADRMFTQSLQNRTIDGGETLHIAERGTPALPQGSYVAVATLRSTNFPLQERIAFEVR
jgi:intracellular proteinase inhibitor BsuPI